MALKFGEFLGMNYEQSLKNWWYNRGKHDAAHYGLESALRLSRNLKIPDHKRAYFCGIKAFRNGPSKFS